MAAIKRKRTYSTTRAGPYKRTRTSPGSTAANPIVIPDSQVRRLLNTRTSGLLGMEVKYLDTSLTGGVLVASTNCSGGLQDPLTISTLSAPDMGDGPTQRDGRQIRMKNITIRGQIRLGPETGLTGPDNIPTIFVALVMDKQTNGAQFLSEQLYTNPSGQAIQVTNAFLNLENNQRFRVLKTVRIGPEQFAGNHTMGSYPAGQLAENGLTVPFTIFHDLKNTVANFVNTGGTVSTIADNSLHIVAFTNDTTASPVLDYNSRLRFVG